MSYESKITVFHYSTKQLQEFIVNELVVISYANVALKIVRDVVSVCVM